MEKVPLQDITHIIVRKEDGYPQGPPRILILFKNGEKRLWLDYDEAKYVSDQLARDFIFKIKKEYPVFPWGHRDREKEERKRDKLNSKLLKQNKIGWNENRKN